MGAPGPGSTQSAEEVPAFRAKQQVERAKADASVGAGVKLKHILVHSQQTQEDTPSTKPEQARSERNTLLASLRATPLNPQGWNRLVQLSEESADNAYINEAYDELLSVYPDAVSAQVAFVTHFIDQGQHQTAEELFRRFLPSSPHADLWRMYLSYVKHINPGPHAYKSVCHAFEFTLRHIGQDKDVGDIWADYIGFVRQGGQASSTSDGQTQAHQLRLIYQRAVQIPLENVEQLWQEYESLESGLNRVPAKKFLREYSPAYMQALSVLRQLRTYIGAIHSNDSSLSLPIWLPRRPTFDAADRALAGAWKAYLRWEEQNPLELEEKDKPTLLVRVRGAYRKALTSMRFFPEIWYMAYNWTASTGSGAQAMKLLREGILANPTSFVLNFACAEALELEGASSFPSVHELYVTFIAALRSDLELREGTVIPDSVGLSAGNVNCGTIGANQSGPQTSTGFDAYAADAKDPAHKEFNERRLEFGVAWMAYMRFARRAEGKKAARDVFAKARADRLIPWQVYEAAARAEYHSGCDSNVATRIFQKGLESFRDETEYVASYLDFLLSINDEKNAGVLFSDVSRTLPRDHARAVWERWARHHYQYGDLAVALSVEKSLAEIYPGDYPIKRFAQRHFFGGTDAIAARDLGFAFVRQQTQIHCQGQSCVGPQFNSQSRSENREHGHQNNRSLPKRDSLPEHEGGYHRRVRDDPSYNRGRGASPVRRERRRRRDSAHSSADTGADRYLCAGDGWVDRKGSPGFDRSNRPNTPPSSSSFQYTRDQVQVPGVVKEFVGALPSASSFNGPVVPSGELLRVFRDVRIQNVQRAPGPVARSPSYPLRGKSRGRPPPDYGPYPGPSGVRR